MLKHNLLKSFFSSGLQAIAVQVLSLSFFLLVSLYLPKESLGIIVTANAASILITTFLSFGLEQVITRRIATSDRSDWAAVAYLFHALAGSVVAFIVLLLLRFLVNDASVFIYLPWFFLAQALMYVASPLKQYLNAKQRFTPYGVIAVVSNAVKIASVFILLALQKFTIETACIVLIVCAAAEFVSLAMYVDRYKRLRLDFKKIAYVKLLKESMPLYLTAVFDVLLKRADAILLGIISTNAITGDYGFAYKAFEMATLPAIVIGPVILAKFAKNTAAISNLSDSKASEIKSLFTIEVFFSLLIPLVLNILWSPVVGYFSKGKYGSANETEFLFLSLCVPLYFVINLFWTLCFVTKKYKYVGFVTLVSAICNLALNLALIPFLGGVGAAIAFFVTTLIQALIYYKKVKKEMLSFSERSLVLFFLIAGLAYYVSKSTGWHFSIQLVVAVGIYVLLCMLLGQINKGHLQMLKTYLKK